MAEKKDTTAGVVTKITDDALHAPGTERPVTPDYLEELRAFVAEQDRITARRRAERRSRMGFLAACKDRLLSMKWQDAVFAIGEIVFMIGLIPSLLGPDRPSAITSLMTGLMLIGFLFVHASFKLWTAFSLAAVTATMWFVLAAQVIFS